jgi:TonB family protein
MRTLALVVVSMFPLFAQEPLPEGGYRVGNGVTAPRLIHRVDLDYSDEALKARLVGTVLLSVVVGTDGKARDLHVVRSLGLGLDERAISAVSKWQFEPGVKDGQPVNVVAQIETNFSLVDRRPKGAGWHLARAEFHTPQGASRPLVAKAEPLHAARGANTATATARFDIDEKGAPVNVQIEKASDDDWARDVAVALSNWRFTPASKDGQPISVPCTLDFVRGN